MVEKNKTLKNNANFFLDFIFFVAYSLNIFNIYISNDKLNRDHSLADY